MTDDQLKELARELPVDRPDAARREAVRSQLLAAAETDDGQRGGIRWWHVGAGFAAGVVAAAAAIALMWRPSGHAAPDASGDVAAVMARAPRAAIEASAQANFEREVTASAHDGVAEVVHLHGGMLRLAVGALPASEHVRVQTRDAVVEGAGDYEVAVADDALKTVTVHDGTARVTMDGKVVLLASGESWQAPVEASGFGLRASGAPGGADARTSGFGLQASARAEGTAPAHHAVPVAPEPEPPVATGSSARAEARSPQPEAPAAAQAAARSPQPAAPAAAQAAARSPQPEAPTASAHAAVERHFQAGYAALRANRADDAAAELAAAADADPADPLAADARYLEGVALVQAHRPGEAERALVAFLDRAPTSLRRGRAAVMLGRLIADRGDNRAARPWFEAALHDGDADVETAARAGLDALDRAGVR
jgi:TolA-binding protein